MGIFRQHPHLLRAFRAGDRDALQAVYWFYVEVVASVVRYGTAQSRGTPLSAGWTDEHSDLVQETFARAFGDNARLAYDGTREYRPYLLAICRNLLVDDARRRGRELALDNGFFDRSAPEQLEPAEQWAQQETMRVVNDYLASLDPPLRRVYEKRYVDGLSQVGAAEVLRLSRQQVRTLEARLRRGLQRTLKKAGLGR